MNARPLLKLVPSAPWNNETDATLVALFNGAGLSRGDAAREIMRRYSPMVRRILRRSLGPADEVADLTQEVFLCLFDRVAGLRKPEQLKSFVISVAINVLRAQLKRQSVRRRAALDPSVYDWNDPMEPEIDGGRDARLAFHRFSEILGTLTVTDRALFVLRFMEELTLVEAAQAAGVSLATAKRRLGRAWEAVTAQVERDPVISEYFTNASAQGRQ